MKIEIRKAGFVNKGAELMLHAILQKMRAQFPSAAFVMSPTLKSGSSPYDKRAQLALYQKAFDGRFGVQFGSIASSLAGDFLEKYGIVPEKDVDIVLDASGFGYSDQRGSKICKKMATACVRWKKQGKKVILLPQAFGPFKRAENQKNMTTIADHSDLIFVRDRTSYKYLTELVGERENICLSPDFTNLVQGTASQNQPMGQGRFCIVPNYRMINKTNDDIRKAYVPFLVKAISYLHEKGQESFILIHEGENDEKLAAEIVSKLPFDVEIIHEVDPLKIKGILGNCTGTIGSRFHGLVSALSQGVPSLAAGWSHKYEMLFNDYDFPEGVVSPLDSEGLTSKIDLLLDPTTKLSIQQKIQDRSDELKRLTEQMWEKVFSVCGPL